MKIVAVILLISSYSFAQSLPVDKSSKYLDDKYRTDISPPTDPPKCSGDIKYHQIHRGGEALFDGYVLTTDATTCMINKYEWCVGSWVSHIKMLESECSNKSHLIQEEAKLSIKQCERLKDGCFTELENANKWYRNPWFIASMGFIAGVAVATTITYFSVTR